MEKFIINSEFTNKLTEQINVVLQNDNFRYGILFALIAILVQLYLIRKEKCRLIYTLESTCLKCKTVKDWHNNANEFISRLIIYNNGNKPIIKSCIIDLRVESKNEIINCSILKKPSDIEFVFAKINDSQVKIEFDFLDEKEYVVLEIKHKGRLDLKGKIAESGRPTKTEHPVWSIFSLLIFLLFTGYMVFMMIKGLMVKNLIFVFKGMLVFLIFAGIIWPVLRFIHKLFFIPDKITKKFLVTNKTSFPKYFINKYPQKSCF